MLCGQRRHAFLVADTFTNLPANLRVLRRHPAQSPWNLPAHSLWTGNIGAQDITHTVWTSDQRGANSQAGMSQSFPHPFTPHWSRVNPT